jgi:hypothetical protein
VSEIPVHPRPRRLADWLNPTGARKVHSLIDKVYQRKNLEMAWERVRANRGSGGVDGQSLEGFATELEHQLERLQQELKEATYQPRPVRQAPVRKAGEQRSRWDPGLSRPSEVGTPVRVRLLCSESPYGLPLSRGRSDEQI